MSLQRFVREGNNLPTGYGVAYRSLNYYGAICYPVPLNLLIRHVRSLWLWMKFPPIGWIDQIEQGAYNHGYQEGRKAAIVNHDAVVRQAVNDAYGCGRSDALTEVRQIIQEGRHDG